MTSLPKRSTDPIALADWLEIVAVASPDHNSSAGDLDAALRRAAVLSEDALEKIIAETVAELDSRAADAVGGYPFTIDSGTLTLREKAWETCTSYLFCLAVGTLDPEVEVNVKCYPQRLFEELATEVARRYVSGNGVRFGFPRRPAVINTGFRKAVQELSETYLKEGGGYSNRNAAWNKDYGVDVVAWRDVGGARPGKLILFGACAAGGNWKTKLGELDANEWCKEHFSDPPSGNAIVQALFFTHRLNDSNDWRRAFRRGIPFDRCRVSKWAPDLPVLQDHGSGRRWTRAALRLAARA